MSNPVNNFFFGKSAFQLSKYDEALGAFERILIIDPNHVEARLELSKVYINLEQYELAEAELLIISQSQLSDEAKQSLRSLLFVLSQKKNNDKLSGQVEFGLGLTTNANLGNDMVKDVANILIENRPKKDTLGFQSIWIGYEHHPSYLNKAYSCIYNLGVYNENYSKQKDQNVRVGYASAGLKKTLQTYSILYLLDYDNYFLLGNHWMDKYSGSIRINYYSKDNIGANLFWKKYSKLNVVSGNRDRDSRGDIFGASFTYLQNQNTKIDFGLEREVEQRIKGSRSDVQNTKTTVSCSASFYRSNNDLIAVSGYINTTDYSIEYADPIGARREDYIRALNLTYSKALTKGVKLQFGLDRKWNASKIFLYQYNQFLAKASIQYAF